MFFNSKIRLRSGFVIATLFLANGFCSPNISRAPNISNSGSNNYTSSINGTSIKPKFDSPVGSAGEIHNVKPMEKTSDEWSVQSVVSGLISSPDTLIRLENLKNKFMNYFEKKNSVIDPEGRGHGGGGGIGFPSLEGALLALAFLTFAVFLIDLIQQLIGGYSSGLTTPFLGRRRRGLEERSTITNDHLSTLTSDVYTSIESPLYH